MDESGYFTCLMSPVKREQGREGGGGYGDRKEEGEQIACVAGEISLVGALAAEPLAPRGRSPARNFRGFLPSPRIRNIRTHARKFRQLRRLGSRERRKPLKCKFSPECEVVEYNLRCIP